LRIEAQPAQTNGAERVKAGMSNSFQFRCHFKHIYSQAGRTNVIIA